MYSIYKTENYWKQIHLKHSNKDYRSLVKHFKFLLLAAKKTLFYYIIDCIHLHDCIKEHTLSLASYIS